MMTELFEKAVQIALREGLVLDTDHFVLAYIDRYSPSDYNIIQEEREYMFNKALEKYESLKDRMTIDQVARAMQEELHIRYERAYQFACMLYHRDCPYSVTDNIPDEWYNWTYENFVEELEQYNRYVPTVAYRFINYLRRENNMQTPEGTYVIPKNNNYSDIGLNKHIEFALHVLQKRTKNNLVIVGDSGVGKTHFVHALAKYDPKHIYIYVQYAKSAFSEQNAAFWDSLNEQHIIVFDDETLLKDDKDIRTTVFRLLKMFFVRAQRPKFIFLLTPQTYKTFREDSTIRSRVIEIYLNEPDDTTLKKILQYYVKKLQEELGKSVTIDDNIYNHIIRISKTLPGCNPEKSIDILESAILRAQQERVTKDDINTYVNARLQIDITRFEKYTDYMRLFKELKEHVYNQDESLYEIAKIVSQNIILRRKNKPIANFLLLGPTGVGKTETAKALSKILFGTEPLILDMTEYREGHSISKLIGAPPGYVGYDQTEGILLEKLGQHPATVILLDEIEKAHYNVRQLWLQALDEARITTSKGTQLNLQNSIIIATSNLITNKSDLPLIEGFFTPEFLNRFDGIYVYNKFSKVVLPQLFRKYLNDFIKEVRAQYDITLHIKLPQLFDQAIMKYATDYTNGRQFERHYWRPIKQKLLLELIDHVRKNDNVRNVELHITIEDLQQNTTKKKENFFDEFFSAGEEG